LGSETKKKKEEPHWWSDMPCRNFEKKQGSTKTAGVETNAAGQVHDTRGRHIKKEKRVSSGTWEKVRNPAPGKRKGEFRGGGGNGEWGQSNYGGKKGGRMGNEKKPLFSRPGCGGGGLSHPRKRKISRPRR